MSPWVHAPIQPLPELLASQIAAGEVVERPASVVKELVENALDAAATLIWVELEVGGRQCIRVRDNGSGIPVAYLPLALGRHCTSKLHSLEQLLAIRTLGFRGEALPSIASVARVKLSSCAQGSEHAWQVRLEGADACPTPEPAAHPPGTTVEVRELFFNVPVRRRFLKSPRTELEHIDGYLRRLALSRPDVGFHLSHDRRRVFAVPGLAAGEGPEGRLGALLGRAFVQAALPMTARAGDLELSGWVAQPELFAPSHSALQLWVINGRVVRDPALVHALRVALDERIPCGRYPAYSLNLGVDATAIDVNVHPAKLEVRHRDPRRVHDFVLSAVRDAMSGGRAGRRGRPAAALGVREPHPPAAVAAVPRAPPHPDRTPAPSGVCSPGGAAWLVERDDALWVLDLARLYAARLCAAYAEGAPEPLPLLIPAVIPLTKADAHLAARLQSLAALGLAFEHTPGQLSLLAAPACLRPLDPECLLRRIEGTPAPAGSEDAAHWLRLLADWMVADWPPARLTELLQLAPPPPAPEATAAAAEPHFWTRLALGRGVDPRG